ncbi:hypothetical protein H5T89_05985 [bacterium]|nr:hypothetical protein [bacterium]
MIRDKRFIILVLAISIVLSLVSISKRFSLEKTNNGVEIIIDSDDFQSLAFQEGISFYELLRELKSAGATTLSIPMLNWQDLEVKDYIGIFSYRELGRLILSGNIDPLISALYRQGNPSETYIIVKPGFDISKGIDLLKDLIGYGRVSLFQYNSNQVFIVKTTPSNLRSLPSGYIDSALVETAKSLGYKIIFRPLNTPYINQRAIPKILESTLPYRDITTALLFQGTEVLGYPKYLEEVTKLIREGNFNIAIVEFANQKGMDVLTKSLKGSIVRLHSITLGELYKLKPKEIVDRTVRAVKERNVRLLYLRPIPNIYEKETLIEENISLVSSIKERLSREGFNVGEVDVLPDWQGFRPAILSMGLGIGIAIVLVGQDILPLSLVWILALLSFLAGGASTTLPFSLLKKLLALGVASIFPIVPIWLFVLSNKKEPVLYKIIKITLLSLIGGLMIGGGLSSTDFMLQIDQFMGVKLAHIIPFLVLLLLIYLSQRDIIINILTYPLNVLSLLVILVFVGGGIFYILRTGNISSEAVWDFEIKMRTILERLMFVRPRTQEFLIGYPSIFLALEFLKTKREIGTIFSIISLITPISIINSFCHIHTPIYITLFRTLNGFILGSIVGYLLVIILRRILSFLTKTTNT